jgi:uncharacterized protein YacL
MDSSKFLSRILGLYLLIVSTAMFVNMQQFSANVNQLMHEPSLLFVVGIFTVIIGLLMVVSHNIWQWNWRVLITIIAWLSLIKGASILFFPLFIDKLSTLFVQNSKFAYVSAVIDFILGLILCYFGFRRGKE